MICFLPSNPDTDLFFRDLHTHHAIGLTVVDQHPERVLLRDSVRRARVKRRSLRLRNLLDLAIQLRSRGLIELDAVSSAVGR